MCSLCGRHVFRIDIHLQQRHGFHGRMASSEYKQAPRSATRPQAQDPRMDGGNKRPVVAVIIVRILNDILTVEPYHPKLLASLLCALYRTGPNGLLELCHLGGYMKSLRAA